MLASGRRVLLTGGAGAIGSVAARALADAGALVLVNDILDPEQACRQIDDDRVQYVKSDGSSAAGAADLVAAARDTLGIPTDVILLAGIVRPGHIVDQTEPDVVDTYRVNVIAPLLTAQAFVRQWRAHSAPGNLVFISSWVQDVPWPGIAPYASSKAAVRAIARSFAREFATEGIRANVLAPGIVEAGMAKEQWDNDPQYRARATRAIPLGALQAPQSVADALVFLCSPMSAYMTGATLLVDGGASLYPMDPAEDG
jgi:NAD(P)-dependent dehydrogenase (short-subunit alcohol dehydrogenase family)